MISVYMNNMETVLHTDDVQYLTQTLPVVGRDDPFILVLVEFVPRNGPAAGKSMQVPLGKIDGIAEDVS